MKTHIFQTVKKSKPFKPLDLLIYAVVVLVCFSLFLGFVILPASAESNGFKICVSDSEIFVFYYDDSSYEIKDFDGTILVDKISDGFVKITVIVNSGGYNELMVNTAEKSVWVTDADCSSKKDCVHTPAVKNGNGAIYCMPHGLKILPLKQDYRPAETGGV